MSGRVAAGAPVIFELLNEEQARARTPFGKEKFKKVFGGLYRYDPDGNPGGYLATDLQGEVERWKMRSKSEQAS
ncbi:hypothetical protein J3T91_05525 [Bifidobacterium sp. B4001]|uniref:hypothetical protein n=1 Tax=unclassified Bifidobacterium TaxID=2608897 RepID=UPI00226B1AA0|nr:MULTISPECIES: hypothetical protein [unclassified Bifidobacterium]MCX8672972.1 hypothetical protein [Bifidobacterium sp. B4079]MCX8681405.1 hypothetical protein [Bifidobacterium sp. B4001]